MPSSRVLDEKPEHLKPVEYDKESQMNLAIRPAGKPPMKVRAGVDIFIDRRDGESRRRSPAIMQRFGVDGARLTTISNRGTKVWPNGNPDTYWSDHWCCRFEAATASRSPPSTSSSCSRRRDRAGFDVIKTEGLYTFNGERGYSLAQGE